MYWINLILSDIITSIALLIVIISFHNIKVTTKNKMFFLFFISTTFLIINYSIGYPQKVLLNVLDLLICSYLFIFDKDVKKAVYYSIIVNILSLICEILVAVLLALFSNYNSTIYYNNPYSVLIFSIINSLLMIIIIKIKSLKKLIIKIEPKKSYFYFIFSIIVVVLSILVTKNLALFTGNNINFFINAFMIFFIIISAFLIIYNTYKRTFIEEQYNQMLEYVTKYEGIINEQGKKNHEYNNQLMILSGYLEDKKYKKVKEYLNTIIGEHKTGQNYKIRQLSNFPNGGLKGLMYYKINKMEENNVKYYLYVSQDIQKEFDKFDVGMYQDITKVFGVFIDNAIEAAKDSDKKEVEIDIKIDEDFIIITISNSYISDEISKVGKTGYSTKGKGHGYGLSLVKDIIRKNTRLETNNDYNDQYYSQTLLIDIKKWIR